MKDVNEEDKAYLRFKPNIFFRGYGLYKLQIFSLILFK